jgi:hypothetical protein
MLDLLLRNFEYRTVGVIRAAGIGAVDYLIAVHDDTAGHSDVAFALLSHNPIVTRIRELENEPLPRGAVQISGVFHGKLGKRPVTTQLR